MNEWYSIAGFGDPMSSISHLLGTAIFLVLSFFLLGIAWSNRTAFWYSFQYCLASVFLLSMSFVYHMIGQGEAKAVMLRVDVAAIFVLIASSFTVVHGLLFKDWRRWGVIVLIWSLTIPCVILRSIYFSSIPRFVGDGTFLAIGWIGAYSVYLIGKEYGWKSITPICVGGICYSVGALMNSFGWPVLIDRIWGPHETFHLLVLGGLGVHWGFVWGIVNGSFQRQHPKTAGRPSLSD